MNLKAHILIDDEVRKQIRDSILSEAKGIARGVVHEAIKNEGLRSFREEINRLVHGVNRCSFNSIMRDVLEKLLKAQWNETALTIRSAIDDMVQKAIDDMVQKAVEAKVAEKMATKTIWDAKGQHEYVQKMVQAEVRTELKKRFADDS